MATINGTSGIDTLTGTAGDDIIYGLDGGDTINGSDGNDTLWGEAPVDLNLLVNGSFEQSGTYTSVDFGRLNSTLPGWTKTNSGNFEQVSSGIAGVAAADGSYWLDLDAAPGTGGNMEISQTVSNLSAGQTLLLQFNHANRGSSATGSFEIYWNGVLAGTITYSGTVMQLASYNLTAVAGNNTLSFKSLGDSDGIGASLDNVRLTSVVTSPGNDTLNGGNGDDTLIGGAGADILNGGAGIDTASYVGSAAVTVDLLANTGAGGDAQGDTFSLVENLTGSAFSDVLRGDNSDNSIDGGAGADTLTGRQGNDVYVVDNVGDVVVEAASEGSDTVRTSLASYTLAANVETLTGTASVGQTLTGNADANTINGGSGNDILAGGAGADVLNGGNGTDTADYTGSAAAVTINMTLATATGGDAAGDTYVSIENIRGSAHNDTITGNSGANVINGGAGDDVLDGGAGRDEVHGGDGNDTIYDVTGDQLFGGSGDDTYHLAGPASSGTVGDNYVGSIVDSLGNDTAYVTSPYASLEASGVEQIILNNYVDEGVSYGSGLVLTSSSNVSVTGSNLNNFIYGGAGNDTINGGDGDDFLVGRGGADAINGGAGTDTMAFESAVFEAPAGVVVDLHAGTASGGHADGDTFTSIENLLGTRYDDQLYGDDGDNVLDGRGGMDELEGRLGNDTYYVDSVGDTVTEWVGEGTDTVRTTLTTYVLGAALENLLLDWGSAAVDFTGNELANVLTANGGSDILRGAAGNDTLNGNDGNDVLLGEADNDILNGGNGNDTLDGGLGNDTMSGGAGNDTYYVDSATDVISEATGGGTDTVITARTAYTLGSFVENLTITSATGGNFNGNTLDNVIIGGAGADIIATGAGNDTLQGNGGADSLNGGAGADTMTGGLGNDTYFVDDVGDIVVEAAGEGTDNVRVYLSSYTLGADCENLTYIGSTATAFTGTGNTLANTMTGAAGIDNLYGLDGNDTLQGLGGNDTLNGGGGDDSLLGGTGADVLTGGAGIDTFRFANGETGMGAAADRITDFLSGTDKINLTSIDANTLAAGDQAFSFVGNGAFTNVAGQLRHFANGADTWLEGDTNGDGVADFTIMLSGSVTPVVTDFNL